MTEIDNPEQLVGELPDVPAAFCVQDERSANWVVRKIVEARRYAEHVEVWAAAEIRRARREESFFLQRFGTQLDQWARQQLADRGGRTRSLRLPAGRIGFRSARPRLTITDSMRLLSWCRAHLRDAVQVVEKIMKSRVTEHVRETGECPA